MTKWALAAAALAFAGLACGGSSGGASDGGPMEGGKKPKDAGHDTGPTTAEACATYADALCSQIASCSKVAIESHYGTMASCVASQTTICTNELTAKSTGSSPSGREACAAALPTWACADFQNNLNPPAACTPKTGSVASGGACAFNSQCTTGFCAVQPKSACGTCAALPAVGDACGHLTSCGPGLNCVGTPMTCQAPVASGGACGPNLPCEVGLSCVGADPKTMTKGMCEPAVTTLGGACDPAQKTAPFCASTAGLVCNGKMKMCETLVLAAPGATCGTTTGQLVICSNGANCSAMPGPGMTGTCIAEIPDKGSCQLVAGTGPCPPGERCIVAGTGTTGTCEFNNASTCM